MTRPNLTPAEALECLRSWDDTTVEWDAWACRYSNHLNGGPDEDACLRRRCFKIIGEELSEHEAVKAKLAAYEQAEQRQKLAGAMAGHAKFMAEQESKDLLRLAALKEPAAAVPSDEEIRKAIYMAKNMPQPSWTVSAIELVCQRIGVKL